MSTAEPNATFTLNLSRRALDIVNAVHSDSPDSIRQALTAARSLVPPRGVAIEDALAVALAAMCNVDQPRSELVTPLGYLDSLVHGLIPAIPVHYRVNPLAVEMACRRVLPARALNPAELATVVAGLRVRGYDTAAIAEHLDAEPAEVERALASFGGRRAA